MPKSLEYNTTAGHGSTEEMGKTALVPQKEEKGELSLGPIRGGQIIRIFRGPRPRRVATQRGRGPTRTWRGADAETPKMRKTRKKCGRRGKCADNIGKVRQLCGFVTCGPYGCDLLFLDKKW